MSQNTFNLKIIQKINKKLNDCILAVNYIEKPQMVGGKSAQDLLDAMIRTVHSNSGQPSNEEVNDKLKEVKDFYSKIKEHNSKLEELKEQVSNSKEAISKLGIVFDALVNVLDSSSSKFDEELSMPEDAPELADVPSDVEIPDLGDINLLKYLSNERNVQNLLGVSNDIKEIVRKNKSDDGSKESLRQELVDFRNRRGGVERDIVSKLVNQVWTDERGDLETDIDTSVTQKARDAVKNVSNIISATKEMTKNVDTRRLPKGWVKVPAEQEGNTTGRDYYATIKKNPDGTEYNFSQYEFPTEDSVDENKPRSELRKTFCKMCVKRNKRGEPLSDSCLECEELQDSKQEDFETENLPETLSATPTSETMPKNSEFKKYNREKNKQYCNDFCGVRGEGDNRQGCRPVDSQGKVVTNQRNTGTKQNGNHFRYCAQTCEPSNCNASSITSKYNFTIKKISNNVNSEVNSESLPMALSDTPMN